jgi:hypothetical protein
LDLFVFEKGNLQGISVFLSPEKLKNGDKILFHHQKQAENKKKKRIKGMAGV